MLLYCIDYIILKLKKNSLPQYLHFGKYLLSLVVQSFLYFQESVLLVIVLKMNQINEFILMGYIDNFFPHFITI